MQTHHVYAQQSTTVSLRIYSNTSWQANIGPAGNQNSVNGYGDSYRNMDCATGDSYSVSVQLPASADVSKYAVINLYENGNMVRMASAQGPNAIASFSGQCGVWESSNSNNGLISIQTDKSSYNYGDTLHMHATLIHPNSPNFVKPTGTFKIVSSTDGSVLFERAETNGCCLETVDIRGSLWEKNNPFWVEFIWGDPNYWWTVYTPIHVIGFENNLSTNTQTPSPPQATYIPASGYVKSDQTEYQILTPDQVQTNSPNPYGLLASITGQVYNSQPNGNVIVKIQKPDGSYDNAEMISTSLSNGWFGANYPINQYSEIGTYKIITTYQDSSNNIMLAPAFFTITNQVTIPEFGSMAEMIIAISLIGVLTVSRKFILRF